VLENLSAKFYNVTGNDLKKVIQDLLDGVHPSEVAKSIDKSVGAVTNFAKANKIRLPEGRRGRKESTAVYTAEQVKKVMDLKAKGENNGAIANQTSIPYNAVVKIIRTNSGVTRRDTTPLPDRRVVEKLVREGATQTSIATQLQVPLHRVAKAMKEYGLKAV
jgi:transposase